MFSSSAARLRPVKTPSTQRFVSYVLPAVPLLDSLRATSSEFSGLYSAKSVNGLWFTRGQAVVDRLNSQLEENKVRNPPADLSELITLTFAKPGLNGVYELASLLHKMHFCWESLRPSSNGVVSKASVDALLKTPSIATRFANEPTDEALAEWIRDSFGSVAELRTLMLNSANAIKGDGATWLVAQATYAENTSDDVSYSRLAVMNTYNAGVVDDALRLGQVARMKQQKRARAEALQSRDASNETLEEVSENGAETNVLGTVEEAEEALLFSERKLVPLLAVDASMSAYLGDYGVFGKQQYLDNVWECIDWDTVARRAPRRFKPSVVFEH